MKNHRHVSDGMWTRGGPGAASSNPVQQSTENTARMAAGAMPIYRVTVTERTAKAINYQHRSGATKIDFRGTELLPGARGEAKVESKQGYIEIEVEFDDLQPATKTGVRIPDLCAVGHHSRRPHGQPGRDPSEWNKEQAERNHRVAGVRVGGHRGTLLLGHAAERSHRDGKRGARGHEGEDRGDRRQVRTVAAGPISASGESRWR